MLCNRCGTMSKRDEQRPTSVYGSPPCSSAPDEGRESVASSLPDYIIVDILAYVQLALGRFATPGEVRFRDSHLYLEVAGQQDSALVSIASWCHDWYRMDEALRRRRAADVARALSRERFESAPRVPVRRVIYLDPLLLIGVGVLALWGIWIALGDGALQETPVSDGLIRASTRPESGNSSSAAASDAEIRATERSARVGQNPGEARSSRVCGATLTRVYQGGNVSVADVDGFRVEIALLKEGGRQPLDNHPVLAQFVQNPTAATGSSFIWEKEAGLAPVETSDSVVTVRRMVLGEGDPRIFGVTLSFGGSLVDPYFKEGERGRFFHIASALADAVEATHVAVYARCFDRPLHALGSWFRGIDTSAAISSLVYFMGTYARPSHLAKPYYQPPGKQEIDRLHAFQSITEKTAPLTRTDLATLLGNEGGMATGRDGEPVIITFPFGDGNRASRASRGIARVAGLGL